MENPNTNDKSKLTNNTDKEDLNKDNSFRDSCFNSLTFVCFIGTTYMIMSYDSFWEDRKHLKPEGYVLPSFKDFNFCIPGTAILCLIKYIFEKLFYNVTYNNILSSKYRNATNEEDIKMGHIYNKKLITNFYKTAYFIIMIIFAYSTCSDAPYFPKELGGNGEIINIFNGGVTNFLYFYKPYHLSTYYLISLSYVLSDLIWLIFIYESQTDFPLMILHHALTISLLIFSHLVNLSHVGLIVLFTHDFTDIFVYISRTVINTDMKDKHKISIGIVFVLVFIYMRLFVFGKLILFEGLYGNDWSAFLYVCFLFKNILMIMHIYWLYNIILRIVSFNIQDVGKVKTKTKNK
jgi:hypothetical protein